MRNSATPPSRFLSRDECQALLARASGFAVGGGVTALSIESSWTANVRWARNKISTSGDVRTNDVWLTRSVRGASVQVVLNVVDDAGIHAAVRRAERLLLQEDEIRELTNGTRPPEPYPEPVIWSDSTYNLDATQRANVVRDIVLPATQAGMVSAGYIEVAAHGRTVLDSEGRSMYYPYTLAQYSVTVRNPQGTGSGWAGVDWSDWSKIDTATLSATALQKCLTSRDPVAVEPGRYTTILEPQAVCDFVAPFYDSAIYQNAKIGQRIIDERLTVTSNPLDPMLGFPPFDREGNVYHSAKWVDQGRFHQSWYTREVAIRKLGKNEGLPDSGAWHMSGGTATVAEMIASTKRGLLVTRFWGVTRPMPGTLMKYGYTRDGVWLIEDGKVSKPVKNFRFSEAAPFVLNNVEMVGVPQRVFHPQVPVVCPPLKVKDFNFTSLSDAV